MLELTTDQNLITLAWDKVAQTTQLPGKMRDFFDTHGKMPSYYDCRRAYSRFYLRGKAILRVRDEFFGVYTADASRQGLRFLAPIQLQDRERCRIRLPKTKEFQIEIVRCQQLDEFCFDCGAVFVMGATGA